MQQAKIRNKKRIQQHSFRAGFHTPHFQDDHLKVSQGPGSWRDLILAQGKTEYLLQGRLQLQGRLLLSPDTRAE